MRWANCCYDSAGFMTKDEGRFGDYRPILEVSVIVKVGATEGGGEGADL